MYISSRPNKKLFGLVPHSKHNLNKQFKLKTTSKDDDAELLVPYNSLSPKFQQILKKEFSYLHNGNLIIRSHPHFSLILTLLSLCWLE